MNIQKHSFEDKDALARSLADHVAKVLNDDLQASGRALLAVSGGSTPKRFFQQLSQKDIDWSGVTITLVDERWVDDTDDRSNARLVKQHLLQNKAAAAKFMPLYTGDATPQQGIAALEESLADLKTPLSVSILGMGTDGHTASFFPGGDQLAASIEVENSDNFIAMTAPGAGEPRITFTLQALLKSSLLCLHIEGEEKQVVLVEAQQDDPVAEMPIRAVLRQERTDLSIYWCP